MKRRLLYLAPALLIFATLIIGFFQPSAAFADTPDTQTQEAAKYCGGLNGVATGAPNLPAGQQQSLCEKGFLAGLVKNAPKPPVSSTANQRCASATPTDMPGAECRVFLTKQGLCYSKLYPHDSNQAYYCQIGYMVGYNNRDKFAKLPVDLTPAQKKAAADAAALQAQADQACQPNIPGAANSETLLQDCEAGYIGSANGKSETQACPASIGASIDQQYCSIGFNLQAGVGGAPPPTANLNLVCKTGTIFGLIPNPLDWALCGVVNGLNLVVQGLDGQINDMLAIGTNGTSTDNPNDIFTDSSGTCGKNFTDSSGAKKPICGAYETAWQSFRNIALGLLVIVGLIIVISQALGMEILDAYTIRRMLPRVLIATIAITLSWQLMRFAITLSNDLGYGVGSLISSPFSGLGVNIHLGTNVLLAGLATAVGAAFLDLFAMLTFVGTAAIAVIITFLVLILRQIAVILLIILAPVAIIAYVLPNTQRTYKFWWESFSKLLLMFPMIVGLIDMGHIFAAIASNQSTSFINQAIALIAYFGPYFMVPLTFRFSGTIMGGLGNAVNARGEGARGFLRKRRADSMAVNAAKLKAGTRFEGKRWIPGSIKAANAFGEASKGLGSGWNGRFGLGPRGKLARRYADQAAAAEAQKSAGMQAVTGWNDVNRVMAAGMGNEREGRDALVRHLMNGGDDGKWTGSEEDAKRQANKAVRAAKVAGGFTKANGIAAYNNMVRDGTAIRDTDDLATLAATVGQGDRNNTFKYAAEGASISRQVGRSDLAAASEPIGSLAFAYSDQKFKNGLHTGEESLDDLSYNAWKSGAGGEVAYTKFGSAKARTIRFDTGRAAEIVRNRNKTRADGTRIYNDEQVRDSAAMLVESQQAIKQGYGKQNNRQVAKEILDAPENAQALQEYLKSSTEVQEPVHVGANPDGTPKVEMRSRTTTNEEVVGKIAGDRFAGMTEEQKQAMIARGEQDENENP